MATSTTKTNKPLNPRGNDQSPLAYNRAKLYSGKALDFDGVNDSVSVPDSNDLDGFTNFTYSVIAKADSTPNYCRLFDKGLDTLLGAFNLSDQFYMYVNSTEIQFDYVLKLNEYLHFTIVFTGGQDAKLYVNGVLEETQTHSIASTGTNSTNFAIGSNNALNGNVWDGHMSNARLFNTALTAAQVADLYNNPEKVVPTGVDNTALKLWLPMMEGAGTKCLDGASLHTATERVENGDFSEGTTGWVGNPETTLSVTNGQLDIQSINAQSQYGAAFSEVNFTSGKYYLIQLDVISCDVPTQIRIGGTAIAVSYATNIWNSGEIGVGTHSILWLAPSDYTYLSIGGRNDVTTLVIDNVSVKEVSVGAISGATWTHGIGSPVAQTSVIDWNKRILDKTNEFLIPQGLTAGRDLLGNLFENVRKQGALNLDGNSWAEVHDNASLDLTTGVSVESWYYHVDQNTTKGIFGKWMASSADRSYTIYMSAANQISFTTSNDGGATLGQATATTSFANDNWYHITGTFDGSNVKIYVNGTLETTTAASGSIYNSDVPVAIGHINGNLIYDHPIAQPRIYNRALTAEEVQRSYDSGKNIFTNS